MTFAKWKELWLKNARLKQEHSLLRSQVNNLKCESSNEIEGLKTQLHNYTKNLKSQYVARHSFIK